MSEPTTEAGRRLLMRESYNARSFPLINTESIAAIEDEAIAAYAAKVRAAVERELNAWDTPGLSDGTFTQFETGYITGRQQVVDALRAAVLTVFQRRPFMNPMTERGELQAKSRARIRAETNGDPSWVDLGDGCFALHIQYGGNAVVLQVAGSGDADAFREWLGYHWPPKEKGR